MKKCVRAAEDKKMPFKLVLPILGGFHIQITFLRTIVLGFNGSGLAPLAVASGIISAGSVEQALKGNHLKRGMRLHKLLYECLVRRFIQRVITMLLRLEEKFQTLRDTNNERSKRKDGHDDIQENSEWREFVHVRCEQIRSSDSEMAKYWLSYLEIYSRSSLRELPRTKISTLGRVPIVSSLDASMDGGE